MKTEEIKDAIQESLPRGENIEQFIDKAITDGKNVSVAVTRKRIVLCKKGIFKKTYEDHLWLKFDSVVLEEGLLRGAVLFGEQGEDKLQVKSLSKEEARKLCGYAKTMISKTNIKKIASGKTCPDCREIVKHIARVCFHCGYNFDKNVS